MLRIEIVNQGSTEEEIGNYVFRVYANKQILHVGRIEGHDRTTRWQGLIKDLNKVVNGNV